MNSIFKFLTKTVKWSWRLLLAIFWLMNSRHCTVVGRVAIHWLCLMLQFRSNVLKIIKKLRLVWILFIVLIINILQKTLEREIRTCSKLIIWTDCDREGENIGFEIINVCKDVKPNIDVLRAKFSEITRQSVHRAVANLIPPDKNVSDAVDVRQELDLRIGKINLQCFYVLHQIIFLGAAFTRFQTLHLKRRFPQALAENLISYGSCQFPTLGFVVERYKAISDFIAEQFWKIKGKY